MHSNTRVWCDGNDGCMWNPIWKYNYTYNKVSEWVCGNMCCYNG